MWGGRRWVGSELKSSTRAVHPQCSPIWHWNPCALWWKKTALNDRSLVEISCLLEYLVDSTSFSLFFCLFVCLVFVLFYFVGCISLPKGRAVIFQLTLFRLPPETLPGITTMSSDISHADRKVCPLRRHSLCKTSNIIRRSGKKWSETWNYLTILHPLYLELCRDSSRLLKAKVLLVCSLGYMI